MKEKVEKFITKHPWAEEFEELVYITCKTFEDYLNTDDVKNRRALADTYGRLYNSLMRKKPSEFKQEEKKEDENEDFENPFGE